MCRLYSSVNSPKHLTILSYWGQDLPPEELLPTLDRFAPFICYYYAFCIFEYYKS